MNKNLITEYCGKTLYFLGKDEDNVYYYLESISFDCGWYYGLNYIEGFTNNKINNSHHHIHTHFMTNGNNYDWLFSLKNEHLSEKDKWNLCELCNTMKKFREFADMNYLGGSHITEITEEQKLVKNEELYKYSNQTIEKLWKMVVEIFETSYKEK